MLRERQAHFDRVRVMLYQPRQVFREVMRSLFQSSGFRKLAYADSVDSLQRHLAEPFFHLMVVHEEGSEDLGFDVLDLVGRLRHGHLGGDPFVPVVATCSNVTHAIARSAMNAGVDQLWNFPLKPAVVSEGLEALALRRPPFVVTTDYMGPDRRKNAREGRQIPRIDVPNKMRQALFDENPEASTTAFRRLFDRMRVERQVEQVAWLKAKFDRPGADVDAWVDRLSEVAEDVRERIPRTRHRGHHGLSQRLLELSVGMKKGVTDERRAALAALCREMEGSIQPVVGLGDSGPQ